MRVSLSWLKELVQADDSVEELAERLSMAGFEVEEIDDLGTRSSGVVVGQVLERNKHPNASRLSVCRVDVGADEPLQIVCGAENVRAGIHVPVATIGAVLTAVGTTIKAGELRGVASNGMICSLTELGLTTNSTGIAILEEITKSIPAVGTPVAAVFGWDDTVLKLAITANRPDGLSMVGVAREVAALTHGTLSLPQLNRRPDHQKLSVELNGCYYTVAQINGVDGRRASPQWLRQRLACAGIKAVNAVVDITNLVMLEQGQPLHAFDAEALESLTGQLVEANSFAVRAARDNEEFISLDDQRLLLDPRVQVVTCHDHPIAIAGVIGSRGSAVRTSTTNIWLESAVFSPIRVRQSSRAVGLRTDASSRFEKGLPCETTLPCSERAFQLLKDQFSCRLKGRWVSGDVPKAAVPLMLRRKALHQLLGPLNSDAGPVDLDDETIERCLSALGCELTPSEEGWKVTTPPSRRQDLHREVDLIEEVARLVGLNQFGSHLPDPIAPGVLTPRQQAERRLRQKLCSTGLQEITTLSLVSPSGDNSKIAISNPLLAETSYLRTNLWEEHLQICVRNLKASISGCSIFELGYTYSGSSKSVQQSGVLSGVICGDRRLERWSTSGKFKAPNYYEARGVLTRVMESMCLKLSDRPLKKDKRLHPGRAATLVLEDKPLGCFGQLHPALADEMDLPEPTYLFELDLDHLLDAATHSYRWTPRYKSFPTVPASERDLAVVVDYTNAVGDLIQAIRKAGKPLLEHVELIDYFKGAKLGEHKVSQAFRLRYRDQSKTLTDDKIQLVHEKVKATLIKQFKAELRS
ncbi:phenylalanine--tRNA ligase subunit beta [Synechococcus sp. M16CYN]|uniref:phenylalanine--tRNA ligase subunit beta n=1 Tax=Synechococcus sp. M16CYN TaxID=3103139 RepID=UPI003255C797